MNGYKIVLLKAIFMLYRLPESERVCSGICSWSPAKGCALGKDRVAKELNSYLEAIRLKIHQIHRELVLDMSAPVTANAILL